MGLKLLDAEDFLVSSDSVQSVAWSTNSATLTQFFTSSVQEAGTSGNYYISVFQTASNLASAQTQFEIAYGNRLGSGSEHFNSTIPRLTPATSIYGQYRSLILEDENTNFTFGDGTNTFSPEDFWAISVDRARYKEKLFPNTFNLKLSGSGGTVDLTTNVNNETTATFIGSNRVYQVVSGSNGSPVDTTGFVTNSGSYGLFLPDVGTILLNPAALSQSIALDANRTSNLTNGTNQKTLVNSIIDGGSFQLNSEETITSDYIFVRARNSEFNYSTNPSFISGSTGEIIFGSFINNPEVYVTTIGLYNDANELVAVAKLSRPLEKNFTKEMLVRVKLDF
tara:strand:+ start:9407 stop:10417 length:1011 start_codon:yes stop_codon:yes gene_type:complete